MAYHLLKSIAASLTRRVAQMNHLPAVASFRCLHTLNASPRPLTTARSIQPVGGAQSLLAQCGRLPCIQPSDGMKTKSALKKRCKDCFFARRRGRLFVFCKTHPRHKQRQG
ncbi:large ribosomal subunit protein bL36m [Nerophis lumbriciformis]|uniref:large ribosomal subunit protein bL36m n=1 Tax=Nerophis lumbriciformis TaxID=546530 RepID=UPI003BAD0417